MEYKIISYKELDSTNDRAKELALFENEGTVIDTKIPSQGRGRRGRSWISTEGKSLAMSIILKPDILPSEVSKISLIGAGAVNLALLDLNIKSKIKWPNDIVLNGKKLCGILSEISCSFDKVNYVIMGIGININQDIEDIPDELRDIATSIKIEEKRNIDVEIIKKRVLCRLKELYIPFKESGDIKKAIQISRENSSILGKNIKVINGENIREALVLDIDNEGRIVVKFKEKIERLSYGEVSIRGINGYLD
jgi:BirA family transcriptional regulator, biotin operon repressor / biotin---[acetyl-CoA-carboxylase] ligase